MSLPKEIIEIKSFLNSCKYEEVNKEGYVNYRSVDLIEKLKKCICFDAALYAYIKLEKLGYETYILSIRGLGRDKNNTKYMKAHSICVFIFKGKYGAIGKQEGDFREPIYTSFEQIALTYCEFLYNDHNLWFLDYITEKISEYKENDYEHSKELIPENTIYQTITKKNQIEINTVKDYLIKIRHHDENKINLFLKYIQTGKK